MSITELKATADKLTAKERAWLRAYLFAEERAANPAWKTDMARRRNRLSSGAGISDTEYRRRVRPAAQKPAAKAK